MDEPVLNTVSSHLLTPDELRVLLEYHIRGGLGMTMDVSIMGHRQRLIEYGFLTRVDSGTGQQMYTVTEKGRVWLDRVLSTPMPVCRWVWE